MTARTRLLIALLAQGAIALAVVDAILFGLAGRTDWAAAWILTALFAIYLPAGAAWFVRVDPDLLRERMRASADAPEWDVRLMRVYRVLLTALFATAALDAGRFRWSHVPMLLQLAGVAGILGAFTVIWWCTAVNHFLSSQSRVQHDRGQRVVDQGPYRLVRHPMYSSLIVLMVGVALLLGSWLALAPAVLIGIVLIVRTSFEDRMLTTALAGYADYTRSVPNRLVPGIW